MLLSLTDLSFNNLLTSNLMASRFSVLNSLFLYLTGLASGNTFSLWVIISRMILSMSTGFHAKLLEWPQISSLTTFFYSGPRSAFMLKTRSGCSSLKIKCSSSLAGSVLCSFSSSLTSITSECTLSLSSPLAIVARYTTRDSFCIPFIVATPPSVRNFMHRYLMMVASSKSYRTSLPSIALYNRGSLTTRN